VSAEALAPNRVHDRPSAAGRSRAGGARLAHASFLLCLMVALVPLLVPVIPPVFDLPNHLARIHVLAHWETEEIFRANFEITSFLIPNVLADVVLLQLMPLGGAETAGRILLVLICVLTLSGAYVLNRAIGGRWSVWPVFVGALLYHEMFFWGFLNYMLGLGIMLWALAAWLLLEGRGRALQLAAAVGFALLIFFAHLVSFGLYAIAIAAIELHRAWQHRRQGLAPVARRLAVSALPFVPPLAVFFTVSPSGGLPMDPKFDFSAWGKFSPFTRLLSSGNPAIDVATLAVVSGVVVLALATRRARLDARLGIVGGLFVVLVWMLPYSALGSFFLDSRVAIAAAFVFVAGLRPWPGRRHAEVAAAVVLVALVGARSLVLVQDWRAQQREFDKVLAVLDRLPPGSMLAAAAGHHFELGDWTVTRRIKPAHEHTALYATVRNTILVPNIFAKRGQNPLVFQPAVQDVGWLSQNIVTRVFTEDDARWLVDQALPVARRIDTVSPAMPALYLIGYQIRCPDWPKDLPVARVHCEDGFSLVQVVPPREPETSSIEAKEAWP